jgi:hypothetical protein
MDDHRYRQFFLDPQQPEQRRYEVVRAFFVERQPMPEIARRYGFTYGTIRNLVCQFCAQCHDGNLPPFSLRRRADVPPMVATTLQSAPQRQRSRTVACSP